MAKSRKSHLQQTRNFVAKHMYEFQHSHVFVDRKKADKRGYSKHKKERFSNEDRSFFMSMQILKSYISAVLKTI
ncbi:MAG: hypothetical protein QM666_10690 [Acinetobacter sp.]